MDLEAVEPTYAGLAAFGQVPEDLVRLDPQVVTDLDRSRVNEGDSCATPKACEQKSHQWQSCLTLYFNPVLIADQVRTFASQMHANILRVIGLEIMEA